MRIAINCPCGATFDADDPRDQWVSPSDRPNAKGYRFAIQVTASEWLDQHAGCAKPTRTEGEGNG